MSSIRIGSGAGYSGDRIEPAVELAGTGDIAYLVFECLAERTIALAQLARRKDPKTGYDPMLKARMETCLPVCRDKGIRIITNMGAAHPEAAAEATRDIAQRLGMGDLSIAAVLGDDVFDLVQKGTYPLEETGDRSTTLPGRMVSANAYLGAGGIVEALEAGADVVITGRVADSALFTAPAIYEFGWSMDDWDMMGQAVVMGHLLECAGQVTGGYFADPGYKDVPDLARLGFPLAEVEADGSFTVTKPPGSGGMVTLATCKEQLLYELFDPSSYVTPDVVADFTGVRMEKTGKNRVRVTGGRGRARTGSLKVSIGYLDGFIGEGQISYGGTGAAARGRLALDIVAERLRLAGVECREIRRELIGLNSLVGEGVLQSEQEPPEVRVRFAGRVWTMEEALRIGDEVERLYTNGPAGGAGAWKAAREIIAVASTFIPCSLVRHHIRYYGAD
ncbi:MAG: DUF1446 domain-containing protein [Syntrophales bacterium]|jgi:hypothetical protein|nr:DUF1446 domain-containing protein [Syntrophales bacterium]MCK9527128.1 DUF1446 domain-containing protein [Syntrophales bacterium]MDX9921747.1 acyclic terpene utilization AtuA family protein [Syntrophales bacterium]